MKESVLSLKEQTTHHWRSYLYSTPVMTDPIPIMFDDVGI